MTRKLTTILAIMAGLILIGGAGILIGTRIGNNEAGPAPEAAETPAPATLCDPFHEPGKIQELTTPPKAEWVSISGTKIPKSQHGPLAIDDGIPVCFTPDAQGAVTAAYTYYAMTDVDVPRDATRKALDYYIPANDESRQTTIQESASDTSRNIEFVGFRLEPSAAGTVYVDVQLRSRDTGEVAEIPNMLSWQEGTWKVSEYVDHDTSSEWVEWGQR